MPETKTEHQIAAINVSEVTTEIQNHAARQARVEAALLTTKKLTVVNSDEDLAKSNVFRKKINGAITEFKTARLAFTKKLDAMKSELMKPEKALSDEFDRLKGLDEAWLAEKARKEKERAQAIKLEEDKKNERDRVRITLASVVSSSVTKSLELTDEAMKKKIMESTKTTFPETKKLFSARIAYKPAMYERQFVVEYDKKLVSEAEYAKIVDEVKGAEGTRFDDIAAKFNEKVSILADSYRKMLPDIEKDFEKRITDPAMTYGQFNAKLVEEQNKINAERLKKEGEEEEKKRQEEIEASKLANSFESQVEMQENGDAVGGRRVYKAFIADHKTAHKVIYQVMLAVMQSERFDGIVARDKNKFPKKDDKGRVVYVDGIQYWLDQIVKCVKPEDLEKIEGLTVEEDIISVAR